MQEKILELLEDRKYGEIAALVKDMNPADAAAMLQELPEARMPVVFRLLPKELAAETFAYMDGGRPGTAHPGLYRQRAGRGHGGDVPG